MSTLQEAGVATPDYCLILFLRIKGVFQIKFQVDILFVHCTKGLDPLAISTQIILIEFLILSAKFKTEEKILNFILHNCKKQTAPRESTAQ